MGLTQGSDQNFYLGVYRTMVNARKMDQIEESLARQGEAFFYIPSSGHEASAALAAHLRPEDWLLCHYRDRALALARGLPPREFLLALLGKRDSSSGGRRMPGFPASRELNILSNSTVVGNSALHAVGVAQAVRARAGQPVVLCSVGDGGSQEGEFLEAVAEAVRAALPVVFLIQDNQYALSTRTRGRTFYSLPGGDAESFYGLPIRRVDGADVPAFHQDMGEVVAGVRKNRAPALVVMRVERLASHTNADDQSVYRGADELRHAREHGDPVANLRAWLLRQGVPEADLVALEKQADAELAAQLAEARKAEEPVAVLDAKRPLPDQPAEYRGAGKPELTMVEALRGVLRAKLSQRGNVTLFGEDIADPKGDVFGLTRGLSTDFGSQVNNAPLSEATIVGTSIGRALAGDQAVALIQFADFLPVAYNQIFSELGSLYWRTKGAWQAPVIVMAVCGAYRPGLGPFHAQTPAAVLAHVPGLDVLLPSNATDAAGLLNAAFASGRPTAFLYPKALLNDRRLLAPADVDKQFVPIGVGRVVRAGADATLVTWGTPVPLCEKIAAEVDKQTGLQAEVIDLRSLYPWDRALVLASARRTGRLLVVHEDHQTCGLGGEILATVAETCGDAVRVARLAQADTYIPYHFGNQLDVLPNFKTILEKLTTLLDVNVRWESLATDAPGEYTVKAIGSSPSDETVRVTEIHVQPGQAVREGDRLASVEADKAAMEIAAPFAGQIGAILLEIGQSVPVGTAFFTLRGAEGASRRLSPEEQYGRPVLQRPAAGPSALAAPAVLRAAADTPVVLSSIVAQTGSRLVENADLLKNFPGWTSEAILQRTGIQRRYWAGENEDVLTLAVQACRALLEKEGLGIGDIQALICSTGTPLSMTPSLSCRILHALSPDAVELPAYDVNAACTGYLYALQQACDILRDDPRRKVLVVTSETLSRVLNPQDASTYFLFGDAATATLVSTEARTGNIHSRLHRPMVSARGAAENILYVPFQKTGEYLIMDGQPVFKLAVNKMNEMMGKVCASLGLTIEQLDMIVPHQANDRIIAAIQKTIDRRFNFPVEKMFSHIREYGNTSSNSIPLALSMQVPHLHPGNKVGLCAFGGGFTYGAAVMEIL